MVIRYSISFFKTNKVEGVVLFAKNSYKCSVVKSMCCSLIYSFEYCIIELCPQKSSKNIIISCVYRTPGTKVNIFNDKFDKILKHLKCSNKVTYECRVFNINFFKY